ncbi:hypothetical protein L6R50_24395 [Myxococcota bacterium]|nr:hypothetical protein [Myxococcota bacterium]
MYLSSGIRVSALWLAVVTGAACTDAQATDDGLGPDDDGAGDAGDDDAAPGDDDSGEPGDDDAADDDSGDPGPDPGEQPPFDLVFKIHIEPVSMNDQPPEEYREDAYVNYLDQVDSVREIAESHGAKLEIHANGETFEYVVDRGDEDRVRAWVEDGHHLGMHCHSVDWTAPHRWWTVDVDHMDADQARDLWEGHMQFLEAALPDYDWSAATPWDADRDYADDLMAEFGFEMMGGGPNNPADELLGHEVWNPWRYATGSTLGEDPGAYAVLIPHRGQMGEAAPHGPAMTYRDNTVGHVKVMALQAYLERLAAERHRDPPKRWVFGILQHDNAGGLDGTQHHDEIEEALDFMDLLFAAPAPGAPAAGRYATYPEVLAGFEAWEEANPGASSFHYEDGDPYPYHLYGLALDLKATEAERVDHVAAVAHPGADGTFVHRLGIGEREEGSGDGGYPGGGPSGPGGGPGTPNGPGGGPGGPGGGRHAAAASGDQPVWLLWREDGATLAYDLGDELEALGLPAGGQVRVVDGETGEEWTAPASQVPAGPVPVLAYPAG